MRTPLVWRLRVTISPWNSWPDFLNEPMLAMSLLLAVSELRDHRGLDGDLEAEGDRRRTRLGRSAAEDGGGETFLPREEWAKPRGRKSHRSRCGSGDRGAAGLRLDQANERQGAACAEQHFGEVPAIDRLIQEAPYSRRKNRKPGVQNGGHLSPRRQTTTHPASHRIGVGQRD